MQTENWNSEDIFDSFGQCENLYEVIDELESHYSKKGQLVCEIRVNDMLLEEDDEDRFGTTPVKDIKTLVVSIGSLDELVDDVHDAFLECIPSLQETSLRASEFFRSGDVKRAQNIFSALLEGCQWLVDTLVHTRRASVRYSSGLFTEDRWHEVEKEFSLNIRQVLVAFEKRDYALLADILEYDVTATLDGWLPLLAESRERGQIKPCERKDRDHEDIADPIIDSEALNIDGKPEPNIDPLGGH